MDRAIYTAMAGAKALMQRQDNLSNNLANVATNGFRADLAAFRAVPVRAAGTATTRVSSIEASTGAGWNAGDWTSASGPSRKSVDTACG